MKKDIISIKICHSAAYSCILTLMTPDSLLIAVPATLLIIKTDHLIIKNQIILSKTTLILSKTEIYYQIRKICRHATYSRSPSHKTEKPANLRQAFLSTYETR
jgi:hypothetical protein